jgi:hypothetical protein
MRRLFVTVLTLVAARVGKAMWNRWASSRRIDRDAKRLQEKFRGQDDLPSNPIDAEA